MENVIINESINELKAKFERIKDKGYIRGINNCNFGNAGLTFEKLIGKENDEFQIADYKGVEIKVKNNFSFCNKYKNIHLFSLVPSNCFGLELKRIRRMYGTKDKDFPDVNVFMKTIVSNRKIEVNDNYFFKLKVLYSEKRIYLYVYDKQNRLIDKNIYWDFEEIENVVERKLNYLCFVKYDSKLVSGNKYYKYVDMKFFKFKGMDTFFRLLENGNIRIYFCLGVYKSGYKKGMEHDHGVTFDIKESDLCKLYEEVLE